MKQPYSLSDLFLFLETQKIALSRTQQKKLEYYYQELVKYAQQHRIISRSDIRYIIERHFISSFYFVKQLVGSVKKEDILLDLGSGAGFPGILISLFFEKNEIFLIDSIRKKTLFLAKIIKEISWQGRVISDRIENFSHPEESKVKIITARALADLETLILWTKPFLLNGAELHTVKGLNYREELSVSSADVIIDANRFETEWINESEYLENKMYIKLRLKNV